MTWYNIINDKGLDEMDRRDFNDPVKKAARKAAAESENKWADDKSSRKKANMDFIWSREGQEIPVEVKVDGETFNHTFRVEGGHVQYQDGFFLETGNLEMVVIDSDESLRAFIGGSYQSEIERSFCE